jgi:superfamily I DNA/RNA helicase/RecB family exonuclease
VSVVDFVRGGPVAIAPPELDPSQRAIVELPDAASAAVLGAPGTGKTTTLVELVADRVLNRGWHPSEVLALTPIRATATRLRDAIALRLAVPTTGPMARTVNSLAFEIVGDAARAAGSVPPRLVTGGEQDADIAGLLDGHLEDGTGPVWPPNLGPEVRSTRRFRSELRELMTRATEFDVSPADLRELGRTLARPEWVASADFMAEYYQVVTAARERQLDQAELAQFAAAAIRSDHPGDRVAALRLVVVDDFQESTEAGFQILRALASRGIQVIAFGDPDVAASSFRGAEPDVLGRLAEVLELPGAGTFALAIAHRQGESLRQVTRSVTNRIGAAAAGTQRAAVARDHDHGVATPGAVASIEAKTPSREWAAIARELRERHLQHGVPWGDLAVVVRSRGQLDVVRRALTNAEVPVTAATGGVALRDDPAARALLTLVDVGIQREALRPELASELLLGPFGGLDPLGLRKLRLALRAEDIAGGGSARSDDLLVEALGSPARLATIDHRVGRAAAKLATTLEKLRESDGSIEELLWLAWSRSGLADAWRDEALGVGSGAVEANRRLDGIVALFTTAKRFAERRPNDPPSVFLSELLDAEVPEDTLSPRAVDDAVLVATPAAMVGREFDTVVVAGLQEGAWPNLRLRGSLLAPQELVRVVLGIDSSAIDERRVVRDDELRLFALATSRARSRLVVAAVGNDDEAVSPFFGLVAARAQAIDASSPPPFSLRGVTGRLRRILADPGVSARDRASAASTLAALAADGVPGADPAQWHGLMPISTQQRLFDGELAPVRPSSIDKLEKSALDWFLESVARTDPGMAANVGTIMHSALELAQTTDPNDLWKTVESRWRELSFESDWLEKRQKRQLWKFTVALAEYLADFELTGHRAVAAEGRFEVTIGDAVVRGSIDRVEVSDTGAVIIVDLKTGTPILKKEVDSHPQLAVYQLAYAEGALNEFLVEIADHSGGGAKLLFVKRGAEGKQYSQAHQAPFDAAQLDAFRDRVKLAAAIVADSSFRGVAEVVGIFESHAQLRLQRVPAVSSD